MRATRGLASGETRGEAATASGRRRPRSRTVGLAAAAAFAACALGFAAPAAADPDKVFEILQKSGKVGVAQDIGLSDDKKAALREMGESMSRRTGASAWVVLLKNDTETEAYARLYDRLKRSPKDVLVVSNGRNWALRSDAITKEAKLSLLGRTQRLAKMERMAAIFEGVPTAMAADQLAARDSDVAAAARLPANNRRQRGTRANGGSSATAWLFGLAATVLVAVVLWRRRGRASRRATAFRAAVEPAELAMTEFYLGMDGVENHPNFGDVVERAGRIDEEIKGLKAGAQDRRAQGRGMTLTREAQALRGELDRMKR